jgi:hypothetical protein
MIFGVNWRLVRRLPDEKRYERVAMDQSVVQKSAAS